MRKMSYFLYGLVCYFVFFITFLYAIGFVGNLFVAKSIDTGKESSLPEALLVDILLLGLFAVQHSLMARQGFKKWWTKMVPKPIERSTYVLISSLALILLYAQWRPIPTSLWSSEGLPATLLTILFWVGWLQILISTFLIDHFDLFGLRQVYLYLKGKECSHSAFRTTGLYKWIRHPIMLGFLIAFWATPVMTGGHFLFSLATTGYILIGIWLEERDLLIFYGEPYKDYRKKASMLFPFPRRKNS